MAKKKSGLNLAALIALAVAVVGMVLTIVGICVDFVSVTGKFGVSGLGSTSTTKGVLLKNLGTDAEMSGVFGAFAYVVMAAAIVCVLLMLLNMFLKNDLIKKITGFVGALTVLLTVLFVIFGIVYCSKNSGENGGFGITGSVKVALAAGAWLTLIGGFLSGIGAAFSLKK